MLGAYQTFFKSNFVYQFFGIRNANYYLCLLLLFVISFLSFVYLFSCRHLLKVGDHNLSKKETSEQRMILEKVYSHPNFTFSTLMNDIALVKLKAEVKLGKFVRTLCLPKKQEGDLAVPLKYGIVAGWGSTKASRRLGPRPRSTPAKILRYSVFPVQHDQLCASTTSYTYYPTVTFCAGDGQGVKDTCNGDSGAAFVRESRRGDGYRWIATGLVSWGEGCAEKNKFSYYTRVYPFIDWIKKTMDEG